MLSKAEQLKVKNKLEALCVINMENGEFTDRKSHFDRSVFAVQMPARVSRRVYPIRAESEGSRAFEREGQ